MSYSIDTNVLLCASNKDCPEHEKALDFLKRCMANRETFYICWLVAMSYLRIATHPSVFVRPLSPEEARNNIHGLLSLPHTRFLSEGPEFWNQYQETCGDFPVRGNLVPDAHVAGILKEHGVRTLYTRDRDYLRFDHLEIKDPFA